MADGTNNPSPAADSSLLPEVEITEMVEHMIDIPVLVEELTLSHCCIYKAPHNLRKVKEEAYTPQCISIGPFHLNKQELDPMRKHKIRYLHFFWKRLSNKRAMRKFKHFLEHNLEIIRKCYAEEIPMSNEQVVGMMLLDAVFIMELFLRHCEAKSIIIHSCSKQTKFQVRGDSDVDDVLIHSWLSRNITRDLILLENQIPFFVLEDLYRRFSPCDDKKEEHTAGGFLDLAIEYFAVFYDTQMSSDSFRDSFKSDQRLKIRHFTDLIRYVYLPIDIERERGCARHVLRTATKLRDSGVSFEKDGVKRRLLDITFDKKPFKARLRIPQLKVDHTTECLFRNLIAFEQCHYTQKPYFCNYVSFIDSLMHTQLDVELLVEEEVIVHELGGDKEVATLINGLSKYAVTNSTYYYETINELNDHYQNKWNHNVAALRLVYFRDLWRTSSTVVGIFVLIFAVLQFITVMRDAFKN